MKEKNNDAVLLSATEDGEYHSRRRVVYTV